MAVVALLSAAILAPLVPTNAQEPDALSVEWRGQKPCEKLHEDDQIRVLRCTFPPGTKHVRHQHPENFVYVLSGGKVQAENAGGTLPPQELATDVNYLSPPTTPWHEITSVGDTTLRVVVIEKKYKQ